MLNNVMMGVPLPKVERILAKAIDVKLGASLTKFGGTWASPHPVTIGSCSWWGQSL